MRLFTIKTYGTFEKTMNFLKNCRQEDPRPYLNKIGERGKILLAGATPTRTNLASESWSYEVKKTNTGWVIYWKNDNVEGGYFNVAIGIQLGHGTKSGYYVEGIDYINPALKPVFDDFIVSLSR